jgi:hypothetical protein
LEVELFGVAIVVLLVGITLLVLSRSVRTGGTRHTRDINRKTAPGPKTVSGRR